jgi:hypothetical protein
LAHKEGSGSGDLVGERRLGHPQLASEQVGTAALIDERRQAGRSDRHADDPAPPWTPEAVGDDHGG